MAVVRCPYCDHDDDRVVDSRTAEGGVAIRRRRECAACRRRYTTFERIEEVPLLVVKRSGEAEPFSRAKVVDGVQRAAVNRPAADDAAIAAVADAVEERMREHGPEVTSEDVGIAVLDELRDLDGVAYLRFASVYKGFEDVADFEREAQALQAAQELTAQGLEKRTAPKPRTEGAPETTSEASSG